ncbi:acetoin utilization protein AcuC [Paenibacillus chartarius]|uniref:Acetoin utilization protein AcuC n=1 Tax=Paenibacillus chartarius TaxID=747481 RepID=A0ABV6DKL4_9BACL
MKPRSRFIYNENETRYHFHDTHPFNQRRLLLTVDLLRRAAALPPEAIVAPQLATEAELLRVHSAAYIEAVRQLSKPEPDEHWIRLSGRYGLDTEDTPYFPGMHDITSYVVGGSIAAAEQVMSGAAEHALHLAGGLHHALHGKGAGFCVYNDASAAIAHIREKYQARVLYIDTDVHHGDGVQWCFYADPNVCTLSIHETGKYLFPGTGDVTERGEGEAFGTSINMPVEPYTEDESWMDCFAEVLQATVRRFQPDVIVSQHGCDAHASDPLAHVHCSMRIYRDMPRLIRKAALDHCGGRWIALGGGGYDIWRVVPRAWSLLWLVMTDHPLVEQLAADPLLPLPADWLQAWQGASPDPLPGTWLDPVGQWTPIPRRQAIEERNRQVKELALMYLS